MSCCVSPNTRSSLSKLFTVPESAAVGSRCCWLVCSIFLFQLPMWMTSWVLWELLTRPCKDMLYLTHHSLLFQVNSCSMCVGEGMVVCSCVCVWNHMISRESVVLLMCVWTCVCVWLCMCGLERLCLYVYMCTRMWLHVCEVVSVCSCMLAPVLATQNSTEDRKPHTFWQ